MIVKDRRRFEVPAAALSRAEVREVLIELWASLFERELRAHLEASQTEAASQQDDGRLSLWPGGRCLSCGQDCARPPLAAAVITASRPRRRSSK
jgi:hypothetical protein